MKDAHEPKPQGATTPPEPDPIDEAAADSFPASDPPTFTGATASPSTHKENPRDEEEKKENK